MIQKIWNKFVNRETISYFIFGVLTTAMDWVVYTVMRVSGSDYRLATVASWCAAVAFAFVTNKLFVFRSHIIKPGPLFQEIASFVACRALTGVLTLVAMMVLVDLMGLNDFIGKLITSAVVLVLNYVLSKIFIFREKFHEGE